MTNETKQALKALTAPAQNPAQDKVYAVYLTIQEIMLAEEALFDRSSVLAAIADINVFNERATQAETLDKKVISLENIARKIALPLDEMYAQNIQ